eukprot:scaffold9594_cov56-Phaeocystis_antarctica.AAC.8
MQQLNLLVAPVGAIGGWVAWRGEAPRAVFGRLKARAADQPPAGPPLAAHSHLGASHSCDPLRCVAAPPGRPGHTCPIGRHSPWRSSR